MNKNKLKKERRIRREQKEKIKNLYRKRKKQTKLGPIS
jgi:hypothetical protein